VKLKVPEGFVELLLHPDDIIITNEIIKGNKEIQGFFRDNLISNILTFWQLLLIKHCKITQYHQ